MAVNTVHALKNAISAYNYGDYLAAIAQLEPLYQTAEDEMVRIQAQKTLIKAYRKTQQLPKAIALCQDLMDHPLYRVWAERALAKLQKKADSEEDSGDLSSISGILSKDAFKTSIFPNYRWRNAGRAKNHKPLKPLSFVDEVIALLGSLLLLLLIISGTLNGLLGIINALFLALGTGWTNFPLIIFPYLPVWFIAPWGLIFLIFSPKFLDRILKKSYDLQVYSLDDLKKESPEAVSLWQDYAKKYDLKNFNGRLILSDYPFIFSYGHSRKNARIVISRSLLSQLDDGEMGTIFATQLGQMGQMSFPFITGMMGLLQLFYDLYWQIIRFGQKKIPYSLVIFSSGLATFVYSIYRLWRLPLLWISRRRVYDSDRFAVNLTGNPNGLSRSLVKIAMGTVLALKKHKCTDSLLEGFDLLLPIDPKQGLSLGSLPPKSDLEAVMRWDWENPHRSWLSWGNSQPLLGDRIQTLDSYAQFYELPSEFYLNYRPPEKKSNLWQNLQAIPLWQSAILWGIGVGLLLEGLAGILRRWDLNFQAWVLPLTLITMSISLLARLHSYFPRLKSIACQEDVPLPTFLSSPETIPSRSKAVCLKGKLLGRRGMGNWLGQDLILHTPTGFIPLHYSSWGGWLQQLFPSVKHPCDWTNQTVIIKGWLRRGSYPWLEIYSLETESGTTIKGKYPIFFLLIAIAVAYWGFYYLMNPHQ